MTTYQPNGWRKPPSTPLATNKDKTGQIQDNNRTQYIHNKQIGFLFPFSSENTCCEDKVEFRLPYYPLCIYTYLPCPAAGIRCNVAGTFLHHLLYAVDSCILCFLAWIMQCLSDSFYQRWMFQSHVCQCNHIGSYSVQLNRRSQDTNLKTEWLFFVWLRFNVVLKVTLLTGRCASPMGRGNHPRRHWQQPNIWYDGTTTWQSKEAILRHPL